MSQIASENEVHPTQVKQWEPIAREGLPMLFTDKRKNEHKELQDKIDQLYKIIGPTICRMAARSFVARAMRSPTRLFWKYSSG